MFSFTASLLALLLLGCGEETFGLSEPDSEPTLITEDDQVNQFEFRKDVKPKAFTINNIDNYQFNLPKRTNRNIFISPINKPQQDTIKVLKNVLEQYALQGDDPWAMGHAVLALGQTTTIMDGSVAIDAIFKYATIDNIYGHPFPQFPKEVQDNGVSIPVEPHTDLMMKVLIETGVPLSRKVLVDGSDFTVEDLYKGAILRAYLNPQTNDSSYVSPNDMPWSIQGITTLVEPQQTWLAEGGMMTSSDFLVQFITAVLASETQALKQSMAAGAGFKKDRTGIFQYTCGGAHLLQSVAYAHARGFGNEQTRKELETQIALHFYRFPKELQIYDQLMKSNPEYNAQLLVQRLKFVGHFLETAQKMSMLNLYVPNEEQIRLMQGAMDQLVLIVRALQQEGIFQNLYNYKVNEPQLYRDIIGDSAHALYAIYLFSGNRHITY